MLKCSLCMGNQARVAPGFAAVDREFGVPQTWNVRDRESSGVDEAALKTVVGVVCRRILPSATDDTSSRWLRGSQTIVLEIVECAAV